MATKKKLMTAEELLLLPDDGLLHELIDGVRTDMSPPGWPHGRVMTKSAVLLGGYVIEHGLGMVLTGDPGIILRRNPDQVRAPDLCFFARDRQPTAQTPGGYLEIVPDFIIEIVSPNDSRREVQEKIQAWLQAGVQLLWAMYPETRSIVTHRDLGMAGTYGEADIIDAEPVLPDFSARVGDFFS